MIKSIVRAESPDSEHGGFVVITDAGAPILIRWHQQAPIEPVRDAATQYAARVADFLIEQHQDVISVNWASVVACIDRVIREWNDERRAALHATGTLQSLH